MNANGGSKSPNYNRLDPAVEARVDRLLAEMTLDEKVGQMVQYNPNAGLDLEEEIRSGRVGSMLSVEDVHHINRFQRVAVEKSRLHIPLLFGNDVIHGYRTVFPIPLAESCTWDPDLLEKSARVAAEEASACGTNWIFAPMVDITHDPRWGRIAEGAGEDPYLGSLIAAARVRGFQAGDLESGIRIVACPKHYVAYGATESGRDYNTVDISEITLREVFLPPFKAAFDAGAGSLMSAFNEINGVPASANPFTLRDILREEWNYHGVVLSDYNAVGELIPHGFAEDLKDAARLATIGGCDIDMMSHAYGPNLAQLVQEGKVPLEVIDEAVRRILRLKMHLGLFERPYADETLEESTLLREDFRAFALEVAQKSMVLLKNDGALPLSAGVERLAVIGPLADDRAALLGCWAVQGHPEDVETVLEGIRANIESENALTYVQGCTIKGAEEPDLEGAVKAARDADVVVLVVGEDSTLSGEANCRAHLGLPGRQQELVDAVCSLGKPVVVVLMTGRPLAIPRLAEQASALLLAWHGGIRAGRAAADLLFGAANPSGKLTTSFPRAEGQIPIYYALKNTGRPPESSGTIQFTDPYRSTYLDEPTAPLFPFGYGLSYTIFEYSQLEIEKAHLGMNDTLVATATVQNTGDRAGEEIVQLYVHDIVGSLTRPVKQLKAFSKIALGPGEKQEVRFEIPVSDLGFIGRAMQYTVEPGDFQLWIGPDSSRGLEGGFTVR